MKSTWMLVLAALVALGGCEMASDMGEMMGKMEKVNGVLKTELNMDAQVGWNIHNGVLAQISVMIPSQDAGKQSVQELKELIYPVIRKHFENDPQVFQVIVVFPIGE